MTDKEIIEFLAEQLIDYYIEGERSDTPCEFYKYNNYGKGCKKKECQKCLIEHLKSKHKEVIWQQEKEK